MLVLFPLQNVIIINNRSSHKISELLQPMGQRSLICGLWGAGAVHHRTSGPHEWQVVGESWLLGLRFQWVGMTWISRSHQSSFSKWICLPIILVWGLNSDGSSSPQMSSSLHSTSGSQATWTLAPTKVWDGSTSRMDCPLDGPLEPSSWITIQVGLSKMGRGTFLAMSEIQALVWPQDKIK